MIYSDILKEKGIKKTVQRLKIVEYLKKHPRVSIKDILYDNRGIDQSTIYRILELFEEKKIIVKIFDQKTYYLFNDCNHKHYIECVNCHEIKEIEVCPFQLIDLEGYQIKNDETIKGLCRKCQNKKAIGIFVGSFNPVTKAHLEIGRYLYQNKIIDEIIYVPCNSLQKQDSIDINHRFEMLKLATKKESYFKVDNQEIINGRSNFSYQEMDLLKEKYKGEIYIILGADNFLNLDKWTNYSYLLDSYFFIVINRFKIDLRKIINEKYANYQEKIMIIDYQSEISSTIAREKVMIHDNLDDFLDKEVINYIKNNRLYMHF